MGLLYFPFAAFAAAYLILKDWPFARPSSHFVIATNLFMLSVPAWMDVVYWSVPKAMSFLSGPRETERSPLTFFVLTATKILWIGAACYALGFIHITLQTDKNFEHIRQTQCQRSQNCQARCHPQEHSSLDSLIDCQKTCKEADKYCDEDYFRNLIRF